MVTEKRIFQSSGLLDRVIESLIDERIFNVRESRGSTVIAEDELISLGNSIRVNLGLDQNLFIRYEELSTMNENESLRDAYRQGFIDGVELLKELLYRRK